MSKKIWSCDFSCIMCMKMLWLALICGDFLILFKKIGTFLDFLRHCFQFCCMYFGWSIPSKKNLCIFGRENVLWLGCKTGHVRCPYLISLRWTPCCQMATRKLPPRVATCPGKRREWEVQKFPSVGLFSRGKFSSAAKVTSVLCPIMFLSHSCKPMLKSEGSHPVDRTPCKLV